MPWVRTGETDTVTWRLKSAWRRIDRRLRGNGTRRIALAFSAGLVVVAIVLVVH